MDLSFPADTDCLRLCDIVQFHSPISGGIRRYVEDKARFFAKRDHIRHAILIPGPVDRTWEEGNTTWVQMASPRMPGSRSYRLFLSKSGMHRFLEAFNPQLIEVADPYQSTWLALSWARPRKVPILLFYHSDYPRAWHRTLNKFVGHRSASLAQQLSGWYLRKLFRACDGVLVSTRKYERLWKENTETPVARIPFGFDATVFHPRTDQGILRSQLPHDRRNKPVLLFAGRLAREKRIGELLEAVAHLQMGKTDAELVIVGDGEDRERLHERAREREVSVTWLPFTENRDTMAAYYAEADALVHAGMHETFGYSVLEAAACGTPSVIFNGSGLEEAAACHPLARIVRRRQPDEMAAAIDRLLNMPNPLRLRWEVHEFLLQERSLERAGDEWLSACRHWIPMLSENTLTALA